LAVQIAPFEFRESIEMYIKEFSTKHNGSLGFNLSLFKCHKEKHDNITEAASLHKRVMK
jgi:hypothetical protein